MVIQGFVYKMPLHIRACVHLMIQGYGNTQKDKTMT